MTLPECDPRWKPSELPSSLAKKNRLEGRLGCSGKEVTATIPGLFPLYLHKRRVRLVYQRVACNVCLPRRENYIVLRSHRRHIARGVSDEAHRINPIRRARP